MTTIADPFALPADVKAEVRPDVPRRGRYYLPWKDGSKKSRGFMRVSNLVSAYSDQFGLRMWEIEQTLRGVARSPELYAAALTTMAGEEWPERPKEERKQWVEEFIEHAKEAAVANEGSKFGNRRHVAVEAHHAGLPSHAADSETRRHLALYSSCLVRNRLRAVAGMQERRVLVEGLEVVGTLDNILECLDTGKLYIADLKTQKRFWTFLEICAQLACYARGDAVWDPKLGKWVAMPKVDLSIGHVLWMPREHPSGQPMVDVYEVDLEAGWATACRAFEVVQDRAAAKSATKPRGWLRPGPDVTGTELMAARFAACDSMEDGRALVAEAKAKGLWCDALADSAKIARDRISFPA